MSTALSRGLQNPEPQGRACAPAGWGRTTASSPQDERGALEGIFRDDHNTWRPFCWPGKAGVPDDQRTGAQRHRDLSSSQENVYTACWGVGWLPVVVAMLGWAREGGGAELFMPWAPPLRPPWGLSLFPVSRQGLCSR